MINKKDLIGKELTIISTGDIGECTKGIMYDTDIFLVGGPPYMYPKQFIFNSVVCNTYCNKQYTFHMDAIQIIDGQYVYIKNVENLNFDYRMLCNYED